MRLPLALAALCGLFLLATEAPAGLVSNCPAAVEGAPALVPTDLLRDALAARGFTLAGWKIDGAGNMVEVWAHEDGTWIVTATSPARCSWLIVDRGQEGGRLREGRGLLRNGPLLPGDPA